MGVINLGTLVEQIRKKLSGSFIKSTDYASASKAGIVKIGNGVNVTSDGTISVNAITPYTLIDKNDVVVTANSFAEIDITVPDLTKYHFAAINCRLWPGVGGDCATVVPISYFMERRIGMSQVIALQNATIRNFVIKPYAEQGAAKLYVETYDAITEGRITIILF